MLKDLFDEDCERYFSKETAEDQKQKLFKSMQQKLRDRLGTDNLSYLSLITTYS